MQYIKCSFLPLLWTFIVGVCLHLDTETCFFSAPKDFPPFSTHCFCNVSSVFPITLPSGLHFLLKDVENSRKTEHLRDLFFSPFPLKEFTISSIYLCFMQFTGDFDLFFMHDVSANVILHFAMLSASVGDFLFLVIS